MSREATSGAQLARQARQLIRARRYREAFTLAAQARDQAPRCSQAYVAEGMALFGLGKYEESLAALAEGLSACPEDYQLLKSITEVALKSEFKHDLRENLQKLEESNLASDPFLVCSFIGQDLHRIRHHQAAIDVLESALEIGTESVKFRGSVLACLSAAYWACGDMEEAIRNMNEELLLYRDDGDIEGEIRALSNLAEASREIGNIPEAISCLKDQIRAARDHPDQQSSAAIALSRLTSLEKTVTTLQKLDAGAHCYLDLSSKISDQGLVLRTLDLASKIASKSKQDVTRTTLQIGQKYMTLKQFPKAIERVERVISSLSKRQEISGIYLEAHATLAQCYRAIGNHEKCVSVAIHGSEKAREMNNPDVEFHCLGEAGRSYQMLDSWPEALNAFEQQRELLSESSLPIAWADCLLAIVDCQEKLSGSAEAIDTLNELISKCDHELDLKARALSRLALFQEKVDDKAATRTVESLLYSAIKLKDQQTERDAYFQLGRLHHRAGRNEQAERCLEKAMQIDRANQRSHPQLEIELARVALELKNYQKARLILTNRHEIESIYILAQIEDDSGNVEVAIDLYKSILSLKSPEAELIRESATNRLAKCFQRLNKHDQAVETLRGAVRDFIKPELSHSSAETLNQTRTSHTSSEASSSEQLHLSLAESLAAIEKIDEAFDEAKQAGPLGSSLRELLLVRMGKLQEALLECTDRLQPGLHFSLCRLDLHCWLVNDYNQVSAFCGQSGAAKQLVKLVQCIMSELAPKLENSTISDEGDDGIEMIELNEASEYLYDALISPFETELVAEQPLQIHCHSSTLLDIPWSLLTSQSNPTPLFERYRLSILPGDLKIQPSEKCERSATFSRIETWETKSEATGSVVISNVGELEGALKYANLVQLSLKTHEQGTFVQLADQRKRVEELFTAELDLSHVDLVVLDRAHSREVAMALIKHGVKNVFYPLWQLPKTSVRDLIVSLEDKLESMHPLKALQEIQFKQKNGTRFKDPSFWSAWIPIGVELNEPETLAQCLYNLLRFDPERARLTLLRVEKGDIPLSSDDKLAEIFIEEFSNLVPSLLALPVDTLSAMIGLLVKPKILHQIRRELEKKSNYTISLNHWSVPGCHELLLSLGLDVVEITDDKVLLFGGNNDTMREFHSCMSQLLAQSPSSTPDQTIGGETELNENSPLVSDTSASSPLRHSESSPFRVVAPKSRKLVPTSKIEVSLDRLLEIKSIPETPKKVEINSGRLSLPPMQHKFRSLWLEQQQREEQSIGTEYVEKVLADKMDESKIFDDQSSGFGSGQNKTEIL